MERFAAAHCPKYHRAVEIIGRRWTGAILRVMLAGATRFSEIRAAIPEMSDKMLTERLRELEAENLVERVARAEQGGRFEYRLTEMGWSLEPVLVTLGEWADSWIKLDEPVGA